MTFPTARRGPLFGPEPRLTHSHSRTRPLCTPHRPCAATSALGPGSPMFSHELFRPLLWCNHSRQQHWWHWPRAPAPTNPPRLALAHAMHVAPNARANTSTGFTEAARLPPQHLKKHSSPRLPSRLRLLTRKHPPQSPQRQRCAPCARRTQKLAKRAHRPGHHPPQISRRGGVQNLLVLVGVLDVALLIGVALLRDGRRRNDRREFALEHKLRDVAIGRRIDREVLEELLRCCRPNDVR